jgi:hypothetical protein
MSVALCLAVLAGLLGAAIHTAHAKSLGGVTSKSLYGKKATISAITDKFDETNNLNLAGTTDVNGDTWVVGPGSFKITNPGTDGYVVPTVTTAAEATVPGTVNAAVGIDLHLATTSTGCGVILNAAGTASFAATFLAYDRNAKLLTLERVLASGAIGWSTTAVKSTVNTYLFLTYSNGVYTAYQDGVVVLTRTLSPAEKTEAEGYTKVGFGSVSGTSCQFDNFQAYAL